MYNNMKFNETRVQTRAYRRLFLLARFVAVAIVSVCLVCGSSIEACPSIPAARFAFTLCFIRFVFVVRWC